jgi:hypothetical protein
MHVEIHAALARQQQEQITRRTRATRPSPDDVGERRTRIRPRRRLLPD